MDRISCLVPWCKRTGKRLPDDDDKAEIICVKHFHLAEKRLRRLFTLNRRRLHALPVVEENWPAAQRLYAREQRLWAKIKAQAIERGAGFK